MLQFEDRGRLLNGHVLGPISELQRHYFGVVDFQVPFSLGIFREAPEKGIDYITLVPAEKMGVANKNLRGSRFSS